VSRHLYWASRLQWPALLRLLQPHRSHNPGHRWKNSNNCAASQASSIQH
jgi:hypothetical protein